MTAMCKEDLSFAQLYLRKAKKKNSFLNVSFSSDKVTFCLNGKVNRHNARIEDKIIHGKYSYIKEIR